MPRTPRAARRAAACLLTLALLAACGRTAEPASSARVLNVVLQGDPTDLNSMTTADENSYDVLDQIMEGLTRLNSAGVPEPAIAKSWTASTDGLTYTFHLRDAEWNTGTAVTADDFIYAWEQALDPRNAAREGSMLQYIQGAGALLALQLPDAKQDPSGYQAAVAKIPGLDSGLGLQAPDAQTLIVTLAQPEAFWLTLTALPVYFPAPQAQIAQWGFANYGADPDHLWSDGPFELTEWVHNDHLEMTRNPAYWNAGAVQAAGVHAAIVSDAATIANLYDTGQIDALLPSVPADYVQTYASRPGYVSTPEAAVLWLQFGAKAAPFSNALVRRAFSESIDRSQFAAQVVGGGAAPAFALTPPTIHYASGQLFTNLVGQVLPLQSNVPQAKADLAAGLKQLGLQQLPPLTLLVTNASASQTDSQALQSIWQSALGIQVQIQPADSHTYDAKVEAGQFQIALVGWNADYDDPTGFLNLFTTSSADNFGGWSDAAFDADMAAALAAGTSGQRGADLAAAERELLAQLPVAPLWWPSRNYMVRPGISGVVVNLTGPDYYLGGVTFTARG